MDFDRTDGEAVANAAGDASLNGRLQGTALVEAASGVSGGSAVRLWDGAYVQIGCRGAGLSGQWSVAAWFKGIAADTGRHRAVFAGSRFALVSTGSAFKLVTALEVVASPVFDVAGLSADGEWHSLVLVGAGGSTALYVDGRLVWSASIALAGEVLTVGGMAGGIRSRTFAQQVDGVQVLNRSLGAGEVAARYSQPTCSGRGGRWSLSGDGESCSVVYQRCVSE